MAKILCAVCHKKCKGDVLKIGSNYVHKECFRCATCKKNLEKGGFFFKDSAYYCSSDYQEKFGVKCGLCQQYVEGDVVTMLGKTFHVNCFRCNVCKKQFHSGDRATLWEGKYFCKICSSQRHEKENVSPASSSSALYHSVTPGSSSVGTTPQHRASRQPSGTVNGSPAVQRAVNGHLSVHISDTGYTSTDSATGAENNIHSEAGYFSQASPCYSLSSGDDTLQRYHSKSRQIPSPYEPKYNYDYGKQYNVSYLRLQSDTSQSSSPQRDKFRRQQSPASTIHSPRSPHFHRPADKDSFSFRSTPTHTLNIKKVQSPRPRSSRSASPAASLNNEEPIRLSTYPGGHEPDEKSLPPIERSDWPAPPSPGIVLAERMRERRRKKSDTLDGHSLSRSQASLNSSRKGDSEINYLTKSVPKSGISQALIRDFEGSKDRKSPDLDPISASRTPSASREPTYRPRYEKHIFSSPSRNNRRDRQELHSLSYKLEYSSTGGRSGTLPSCPSTPRPGYTQGYIYGSTRTASLPRAQMEYSDFSCADSKPSDDMDGQISPAFTTSVYSVDGADSQHATGYMSSTDHPSSFHGHRRPLPRNIADMELAYPSVQSWLRPSSFFRMKETVSPHVYPYEQLKITNFSLPKDVDRNNLELHLSDDEFELYFQMSRAAFRRLPEWKRNDIKRRLHLF